MVYAAASYSFISPPRTAFLRTRSAGPGTGSQPVACLLDGLKAAVGASLRGQAVAVRSFERSVDLFVVGGSVVAVRESAERWGPSGDHTSRAIMSELRCDAALTRESSEAYRA